MVMDVQNVKLMLSINVKNSLQNVHIHVEMAKYNHNQDSNVMTVTKTKLMVVHHIAKSQQAGNARQPVQTPYLLQNPNASQYAETAFW